MAEILYRMTIGIEPRSPRDVADDYGLPIEAVLEAIHYCERNPAILDEDRRREEVSIKEAGRDRWPYAPVKPTPRHEAVSWMMIAPTL
jgi:hypothetical protein